MKKVYIITTYTGTTLSYLIKNISKTPYAHVSIALNEELMPMYSFGRLNPKTPIFAGNSKHHLSNFFNWYAAFRRNCGQIVVSVTPICLGCYPPPNTVARLDRQTIN